jgi:hypothetical protein
MVTNSGADGLRTVGDKRYLEQDGEIVGFGDAAFQVRAIPRKQAIDTIREHHYSRSIVNNAYVHLGVFWNDEYQGALQFGYALNPARAGRIVAGTGNREYLELNRMWVSDTVPRNGESKAIAYAIRYIRRAYPQVGWIQSFADERCGRYGVVYQACNFLYVGSHLTDFYELDGQFYHKLLLTAHKKSGGRGRYLRENLSRAVRRRFRQFRYLHFLHPPARRRLLLTPQPYPKPDTECHE